MPKGTASARQGVGPIFSGKQKKDSFAKQKMTGPGRKAEHGMVGHLQTARQVPNKGANRRKFLDGKNPLLGAIQSQTVRRPPGGGGGNHVSVGQGGSVNRAR